jgi:hypothetical protein
MAEDDFSGFEREASRRGRGGVVVVVIALGLVVVVLVGFAILLDQPKQLLGG